MKRSGLIGDHGLRDWGGCEVEGRWGYEIIWRWLLVCGKRRLGICYWSSFVELVLVILSLQYHG